MVPPAFTDIAIELNMYMYTYTFTSVLDGSVVVVHVFAAGFISFEVPQYFAYLHNKQNSVEAVEVIKSQLLTAYVM